MDKAHSRDAASDDASVTTTRYRVRLGFAHRTHAQPGRGRGFTLVELVMVILLLGVMATFSSQFIGRGFRDFLYCRCRDGFDRNRFYRRLFNRNSFPLFHVHGSLFKLCSLSGCFRIIAFKENKYYVILKQLSMILENITI